MFESIPQNTVQAASVNCLSGGSAFCGPDIMTAVEMMLVKDYDDQLKSTAAEMKTMTKVKQAYRKNIADLNKLLSQTSYKKGKKGSETDCVLLTPSQYSLVNTDHNQIGNSSTISVTDQTTAITGEGATGSVSTATNQDGNITGYYVDKTKIETRIEALKMKLDTVNEQTEITSLSLQTLTNQRKIAFETVSAIIKKQEDAVSTIIRNIS